MIFISSLYPAATFFLAPGAKGVPVTKQERHCVTFAHATLLCIFGVLSLLPVSNIAEG